MLASLLLVHELLVLLVAEDVLAGDLQVAYDILYLLGARSHHMDTIRSLDDVPVAIAANESGQIHYQSVRWSAE